MRNYHLREQSLGHMIPLKTAAKMVLARATIRLGIYTLIANI